MAHPFPDGSAIALHRDLGATAQSLEPPPPAPDRAWSQLIDQYRPLAQDLVEAILGRCRR